MRKLALLILLTLLCAVSVQAQYVKVLGTAQQSQSVVTSGISSTTKAERVFPSATIDIYAAGTTNHVSIYSNSTGTVKGNPFTADSLGIYDFFVAPGTIFDVRISGLGVTTPFTRAGYTAPGTQGYSLALCGGTNDTALLAALNALGGTIEIPKGTTCASNTQTLTAALQVDNGGLLKPITGQTVTLGGAVNPDPWQHFTNATAGLGTIVLNGAANPFPDWWTTNTIQGTTNMTAASQAAIDSLSNRGGKVTFLTESYLLGQINVTRTGITLEGQGGHTANGPKPTTLVFTSLPNGSSGIVDAGFYGLTIRNLYLELITGTGGAAIKVSSAGQVLIENVGITTSRGSTSFGIQFGDRSLSSNAVTTSTIRHVTIGGNSDSNFLVGMASTSVHIDNVYSLGATNAGIEFYNATYSQVTASAIDSGLSTAGGYLVNGSTGIFIAASGAENNGKGFARITGGSTGVTIVSGRGVGNNTSADATIGSFLQVDTGGNYNITLIGCTDSVPNAATTFSIRGEIGTLWTYVIGYNTTAFPKAYGGDATWKDTFLTLIGTDGLKISAVMPNYIQWITGTKPTCSATFRGTVWYVAGAAGVKDTFEVCTKDAANAYAWRVIY